MELYEVPHGIGTNYNFELFRKRELSKLLYINRVSRVCTFAVDFNYLVFAYLRLAYLRLNYLTIN